MKTIEEKAKAYDEAIKRVENIMNGKCETTFMFTEGLFEHIFPELKESESIRLWLIDLLSTMQYHHCDEDMEMGNKAIAWLEKQGEQKPVDISDKLKEKYTWEPSDGQMKILNEVLNFAANHESAHWNYYIFGTLNNLIRQLKKLREE